MIALRMRLLAGLAVFLGVLLGLEWLWPAAGPTAIGPLARLHAQRSVSVAARETGSWAGAILARPVFSISRRPPKLAAPGKQETAPGQARLAGIMITRSGRRAIFAPDGGGRALVLAERAPVNQGTIRSIFPDRVVMADGTVLRPSYDRNRAPGATTTLPFQPPQPNFGQAGFPGPNYSVNQGMLGAPGMVQMPPGLQPQGLQPQGLQPQGLQNQGVPAPNGEDGQPQVPVPPVFRGTLIPPRRE